MNAIDFIKHSLESSKGWAMGLIADMQDAPLQQPTSKGGNHPLWVIGHLARGESDLLDCFIHGRENRFPELESKFAMKTTPTTNANDYPSMEELMAKFEEIRAATLAYVDTLTEADLDKPSKAPEEFGDFFGTIGKCLSAMCTHVSFHAGQVADARRAAGRGPLMA